MQKPSSHREMSVEQLQYELSSVRSALLDRSLRGGGSSGDSGPAAGELRRSVARILTVIREKEIHLVEA